MDAFREADHSGLRQRLPHAGHRLLAIGPPDEQLGDHRIVVGRDLVALLDPGINANRVALGWWNEMDEAPGRRQETFVWILGIDSRLDCMTVDLELLLGQGQRLTTGDPKLPLDEIEPGDHLRNGMFDLETCIHLHEIETAVLVRDELDGPRADIADRLRSVHGRLSHRGPSLQCHAGCGRFLEQLLMPALKGAVALDRVDAMATS